MEEVVLSWRVGIRKHLIHKSNTKRRQIYLKIRQFSNKN